MKPILFTILIISFVSCSNNKRKTAMESNSPKLSNPINDGIKIDTTHVLTKNRKAKNWSSTSDYYGVYRFSKDIIGLGFDIDDGNNMPLLDSLFNDGISVTDTVDKNIILDKKGVYNIYYSEKLAQSILRNDTSKEFYVYCTNGLTKAKIEKVLYGSTDCSSVLILKLSNIDTNKYGHPVIASKKRYDLSYKNIPYLQKGVENYENILNKHSDYKDSLKSKQFAFNPKLFFTYSDDFKWFSSKAKSKSQFPLRMVFRSYRKSAKLEWIDGIDLFGIGCD